MKEALVITSLGLQDVLLLRQEVMYPEYPIELSKVEGDEAAIHWGLKANGQLVSVISLFESQQFGNTLQFRKFATKMACQGKGYGSFLFEAVLAYAKEKKYDGIWCNARISALSWYERFGFKTEGQSWQKLGIEFIIIHKVIK